MWVRSDASDSRTSRWGIGMSKPAITALIANRPLCDKCIASLTATTPDSVNAAITVLSRAGTNIDLYINGTCPECGEEGLVYAIDRPRSIR